MSNDLKSTNRDEWHNVTLRPVGKPNDDGSATALSPLPIPIAPPRRKRNFPHLKSGQPGGFKDVFGNLQRRASVDSAISTDRSANTFPQPKRFNSSSDVTNYSVNVAQNDGDGTRTHVGLKRKISKVGNRKSDKFFGENLSDCLSDEQIEKTYTSNEIPDALDIFVSENGHTQSSVICKEPAKSVNSHDSLSSSEEPDANSTLNLKAEFLMAMLESHNRDEIRYMNRTPVEEPKIVPKRKHGRHICDDNELIKNAIDKQSKTSTESGLNISNYNDAASPKKPGRDMSKYRTSKIYADKHSSECMEPNRPVRRKSSLSREHFHKTPPTPVGLPSNSLTHHRNEFKSIQHRQQDEPNSVGITNAMGKDNNKHNDIPNTPSMLSDDKLDTILKKCNSSHSFLTPDLMDQIVNKVYGFKMNWDDHENVRNSCYDDGSAQVAPSSKLKTRKISVIRNKELTEKPILEENTPIAAIPTFSIGYPGEHSDNDNNSTDTNAIINTVHDKTNETTNEDGLNCRNVMSQKPLWNDDDTDDVLSVVSRTNDVHNSDNFSNAIKRSDTIIELQPKEFSNANIIDNIYASNKAILDNFQNSFSSPSITNEISNTMLSKCPPAENLLYQHNLTKLTSDNDQRRGSIVDHDQWFNLHKMESSSNEQNKRNVQNPEPTYDTRKLFPFGRRERSYSESSEFFNDHESLSSSVEQLNDDELASKLKDMMEPDLSKNDHSLLLKFISAEHKESE